MIVAVLLSLLASTITARRLASVRREYRPVGFVLALGLFCDVAGELLRRGYLDRIRAKPLPLWLFIEGLEPKAPTAYTGMARAAFHGEQGLLLAWPAAVVALALHVLTGKSAGKSTKLKLAQFGKLVVSAAAWLVAIVVHVVAYPTLRGELLAQALRLEQGIAVAALAWCVARWRRQDRSPEHAAAIALAIAEVQVLLFSYTGSPFELWIVAQIVYTITFTALAVLQWRWRRDLSLVRPR